MTDDPQKRDPSSEPSDESGRAPLMVIGVLAAMFVALLLYGVLTR